MPDLSKIKETIRQLLHLAEDDAAADLEAENALRFARRLMLRHNIDEKDVAETKDAHEIAADAESVDYGDAKAQTNKGFIAAWERSLAWAITDLIGSIKHYYQGGTQTKKTEHGTVKFTDRGGAAKCRHIVFYGPTEDSCDAVGLFDEWSLTIIAMARLKYGGVVKGPGRSYAEGFASSLQEKVSKIKREERQLAAGYKHEALSAGDQPMALMVINATAIMKAKRDQAKVWLRKQGIRLRSIGASSGGQHHGDAWKEGRTDGSAANFSRNKPKKLE